MPCDGAFAVGATAADAPPAIAKDIPAAPHAGKAVPRRLRFEVCFARAIMEPSYTTEKMLGRCSVMHSTFLAP
jgi:hypothetical protein